MVFLLFPGRRIHPHSRQKDAYLAVDTVVCVVIRYASPVSQLRVREVAELMGVSDDSVRRWIDEGALTALLDEAGRKVIDGADLAEFARAKAGAAPKDPLSTASSARNRLAGIVTKVVIDKVMAQVEMQCGPFTIVSLMSAEAARELGLEPGSVGVAVVKATTVIVETDGGRS
jgi:molybdopterin-binding protein